MIDRTLFACLCILVAVALVGLVGCASVQPAGFPKEFGLAAQQISTSIADQAVWSEVLARLHGQLIEPGMEGYAGVLYVAGGKLRGVSGQLNLEAGGKGKGELSDEGREAVLDLAKRPDLVELILRLLAEKRAPAPAPETHPAE